LIIVQFSDIERAAERLELAALLTPVLRSRTVDRTWSTTAFFKCENFQRAGAFKFRGAYNALASLGENERRHGVLTFSSGNHAQAMALAGQLLDVPVHVIMPDDAPAVKREATEGYGAHVITYDRASHSRESVAADTARELGVPIIPPYDHPAIVAGQGTAARELLRDYGPLDLLLAPCGGGGLLSGSAIAAKAMAPGCRVVGVEPEAGDDATRSFLTGTLQTVDNPDTIADGARTPSLGKVTFPIVMQYVDEMVTVTDDEIRSAMKFLMERLKIVVEPTGALAFAAVMSGAVDVRDQRVGIIVSGGNVDIGRIHEILGRVGGLERWSVGALERDSPDRPAGSSRRA
jgi:threonine dehydratase